jgi:transposase
MSKHTRRNRLPAFKAKVALAAIQGEQTLAELAQRTTFTPRRSPSGKRSFYRGGTAERKVMITATTR